MNSVLAIRHVIFVAQKFVTVKSGKTTAILVVVFSDLKEKQVADKRYVRGSCHLHLPLYNICSPLLGETITLLNKFKLGRVLPILPLLKLLLFLYC